MGHAEPQDSAAARQPYWMPFSPNKFVCGQPEQGADLADDLQGLCSLYGGENIAACFVEPTAGSFGCLPPPGWR